MHIVKLFWGVVLIACIFSCKLQKENETIGSFELSDYLIAYNVAVDIENDDYDIWTVDPLTKERKNITNNPDVAWTYHAVGKDILFISDRDTNSRKYLLYSMNASGNDIKPIGKTVLRDSWMGTRNNGSEIIVNPSRNIDSAFLIVNRTGEVIRRIETGIPNYSDPSFSPDGKTIAFRGGTKKSKREEGYEEAIYLIDEYGSNLQTITEYPANDTTAAWYAYKAGAPKWHPTENYISYHSFQDGKYSLYSTNTADRMSWKLLNTDHNEGWHDWSPDGKWLVVELFDTDQTQFHIGLVNMETQELELLTDTSFVYQQSPVFVEKK